MTKQPYPAEFKIEVVGRAEQVPLCAGEADPHYAKRDSPSKLDFFALKFVGWLETEAVDHKCFPRIHEFPSLLQQVCAVIGCFNLVFYGVR